MLNCAQTNVELPVPVDLSGAPSDLVHSVVEWLYSDHWPSFYIERQPRYEENDWFFPDLARPIDMDTTYNDAWLMEEIRNDILDSLRSFRHGAETGCRYRSSFSWAHDKAAIARVLGESLP